MAIQDDFTIDYVNKRIYHSAGTTVYTVNALYSWLMDTFDEQGAMDDDVPMSAQTPTEYTMINGWYFGWDKTEDSTYYLKTGAIKTDGYLNAIIVVKLQASGYTNCVAGDIGNQVQDDGVEIGPLLAYNNTSRKWWVRTTSSVAGGSAMTITGGTGAGTADGNSVTGEDLYANVYTLGTIESGTLIYICQAGVKIDPDWWDTGHIDVLVKVKEAGIEFDGAVITLYARMWTDLYDHYEIDLTAGGRNAVPLATSNDLDNQTTIATVKNYLDKIRVWFVNWKIDYDTKTGDDPAVGEVVWSQTSGGSGFIVEWSATTLKLANKKGTFADNDVLKILAKLKFDAQTTFFSEGNVVTGQTSGASGTCRRVEQFGTVGVLWLSAVTGTFQDNENLQVGGSTYAVADGTQDPSTFDALVNITNEVLLTVDKTLGGVSAPYNVVVDLNARTVAQLYEFVKAIAVGGTQIYDCFPVWDGASISILDGEQYQAYRSTYLQKKASPLGTFAGGKFFGARGIWIEDMYSDDVQKYSLIDANGTVRDPPNLQSFKVTALAVGDRVMIAKTTGDNYTIDKSQYSNAAQASGLTYVEVQQAIPDDTPETGVIRVRYNVGTENEAEDIYTVTSLDKPNKRFNISGTTVRAYTTSDRSYVPYMDKAAASETESVTVTYVSDRYVVCRVRKKGIIPFQTKGQYTSTGYAVAAIRTTDTIVT